MLQNGERRRCHDGKRQAPTLILSDEEQISEHERQREHVDHETSRFDLLVREACPFDVEAFGQHFAGKAIELRNGLPRAVAGCRHPLQLSGVNEVVPVDCLGPDGWLDSDKYG